ncbi:hypothetical protein NDU88_005457 [Pleurodeles waltl]|uniref:Uncharacterized protein n=1 Tax=Pleurodeles waltl TaxID=8319 RepID=A0AAV7QG09_PLEWA|nr:hypothetical protein NDU88_005457 [Pleurodeles waltl]
MFRARPFDRFSFRCVTGPLPLSKGKTSLNIVTAGHELWNYRETTSGRSGFSESALARWLLLRSRAGAKDSGPEATLAQCVYTPMKP